MLLIRLLRQLKKSFLATQALCAGVALFMALLGSPLGVSLLYSLLIGNFSSLFIHLQLLLFSHWQGQALGRSADDGAATPWPGWTVTLLAIVVGVALGFGLGALLADQITGFHVASPGRGGNGGHGWRIFGISLVPAGIGTLYFYSRARLADAETQAADARRLASETRLKLLESQLEPHMLFNTLANLRALIAVDPDRAQQMLDHLIAFLRATLSASRTGSHALSVEFDRLADYLALMQVRMGSRLQTRFELPPELASWPVPSLLLQPLVENAIQHGLEPQRGGGQLQVQAQQDDRGLLLSVRDTGLGLQPDRPPRPGGGFGLSQVRERLLTLYGDRASLSLQPAPGGGTLVQVRLPWPAQSAASPAAVASAPSPSPPAPSASTPSRPASP